MFEPDRTLKVVVCGASFAGRRVATLLAGDPRFEVSLVDEKEYTEFTPSILRTLVEPKHAVWGPAKHVTSRAVDVSRRSQGQQGQIMLADGTTLPFEYLILATGSGYAWPIKASSTSKEEAQLASRMGALAGAARELQQARSVVVIGGGPVGVELAAELAGKYGCSKAITLITTGSRLLPRMPERAGRKASRWLRLAGVELVLGERVVLWPEGSRQRMCGGTVVTDAGRVLTADQVLDCSGAQLNTKLYACLVGQRAEQDGALQRGIPVKSTLEVVNCPGVFACGDVAGVDCERTAYTADLMAIVVAKNVMQLADEAARGNGSANPLQRVKLKEFPGGALGWSWLAHGLKEVPSIAAISLYKHDGILQFNSTVLTGSLAALTKSMVEYFQLGIARGDVLLTRVWFALESTNTLLAALPLVLKQKWAEAKAFIRAYEAF